MPTSDPEASRGAWTRYWRSGALHSCAGSYAGNYDGAIGSFWSRAWARLGPGDRVLDLASGNGALPRLLLDRVDDPGVGCDAVDLAPVGPAWVEQLPAVQRSRLAFHGGTPAESLPFAGGSHALVTSQYGLEYTDLDRSVPELLRVLRRPGRVALLLHHAASRPVALARDELGHIDWLRAPQGLLDAAAALLEPMARSATAAGRQSLASDAEAGRRRERFNLLQRELDARSASSVCPDVLHETREGLAAVLDCAVREGAPAAAARLGALDDHLGDSRLRLADLLRCALDERGLAALLARFRGASSIETGTVTERGWLMGWTVEMGFEADPEP